MLAEPFLSISPVWLMAAGFTFGAVFGSFLATIVTRWPNEASVLTGRSRCDGCARGLGVHELLPIISYAFARGQCRECGKAIDPVHPAMEFAAGCIGAMAIVLHPNIYGLGGMIFGWGLLTLAVLDVRHFWLPDKLTLPLMVLGIGLAAFTGMPSLQDSLIGGLAGFGCLWAINIIYRKTRGRDGLGGGDAKLLAAIGAWLGWQMLPFVLFFASSLGLILVLGRMAAGQRMVATDRLPFGALLAVAAWPLWLAGEAIRANFAP